MSLEQEWDQLVREWRAKQDALLGFNLFDNGLLQPERLHEHDVLRRDEREARAKMDHFIENYRRTVRG